MVQQDLFLQIFDCDKYPLSEKHGDEVITNLTCVLQFVLDAFDSWSVYSKVRTLLVSKDCVHSYNASHQDVLP